MLTPFQRRKLTRRFHLYDPDRTGRITWADFERVLNNVLEVSGWALDAQERHRFMLQGHTGWQLLAAAADVDHDAEVTLEEWLAFYEATIVGGEHAPGTLPEWLDSLCSLSFDAMDADGDGAITRPEYRAMAVAWGLEPELVEASFEKLDANGDGTISRQEWRTLNVDFYLGDDPKAASTWLWGDVYKTLFK